MGRVGEVICRTWQTADKMKKLRGRLADEKVPYTSQLIIMEIMIMMILKYILGYFRDTSLRLVLLNNDKIDVDKCKLLYTLCIAMHFC